jgi:hypothetical protein
MEIISLRGNSDVGKSETLNLVYQLMLLFGYTQAPSGPRHFEVLHSSQKDFIDILEKKGQKIGIVTMGDHPKGNNSVSTFLSYLELQGCDKAICACNINKPGTVQAIIAYPIHYIIDKTTTSAHNEQRIKNGEDAEKIYKLI